MILDSWKIIRHAKLQKNYH